MWCHHSPTTENYHTIFILKLKNWPCEWELSLASSLPPARLRQNIVTAPSDTYFPFWHFNLLVLAGRLLLCSAMFCSLFFVKFIALLTCITTLIPGRKFANQIKRELQAHTVFYCFYKTLCTHAEKTNILLVQRQQPALPEKQSTWKQTSHFQQKPGVWISTCLPWTLRLCILREPAHHQSCCTWEILVTPELLFRRGYGQIHSSFAV